MGAEAEWEDFTLAEVQYLAEKISKRKRKPPKTFAIAVLLSVVCQKDCVQVLWRCCLMELLGVFHSLIW